MTISFTVSFVCYPFTSICLCTITWSVSMTRLLWMFGLRLFSCENSQTLKTIGFVGVEWCQCTRPSAYTNCLLKWKITKYFYRGKVTWVFFVNMFVQQVQFRFKGFHSWKYETQSFVFSLKFLFDVIKISCFVRKKCIPTSKVWREKEKNQQDATIKCLLLTSVSTCFGYHYAHLQENKRPVTAFGVYWSGFVGCGW